MVKLIHIKPTGDTMLDLAFSDGATARWSADDLIARDTVMTRPLAEPDYFARVHRRWRTGIAQRLRTVRDEPASPA